MSCTIVVGGQYGSEGKGKVTALVAATHEAPCIVRCGGPNSGHTVTINGKDIVLRQIPAGAGHPNARLFLCAGCVIDLDVLSEELERLSLPRDRITVDPRAVMITKADLDAETVAMKRIGSTGSGTGSAQIRRMSRDSGACLAADCDALRRLVRVEYVAPLLHYHLDHGNYVIIEGTQGFGLSLLHGPHYPYVTSRDTSASGFAAEVGLSPRDVDSIILVIRTFPIRVGGNSGPLDCEITWEQVQKMSGAPQAIPEFTSVTRRLRRVAKFDLDAVKTASRYNRPTSVAIMGVDRLDYVNTCVRDFAHLTPKAIDFVRSVESATGVPVEWVGTGFYTGDAIRRPTSGGAIHV